MTSKTMRWATWGLGLFLPLGCIEGTTENGDDSDALLENSQQHDSETATEGADTDTLDTEPPFQAWILVEDFEHWELGDREFFMTIPEYSEDDIYAFDDNGTPQVIDDGTCLMIHDYAIGSSGYAFAVEFQLALDNSPVDMRGESGRISFDIYIPQKVCDLGANVLFGFYEMKNSFVLYSHLFPFDGVSFACNTWETIEASIDTRSEDFVYSSFIDNPDDWSLDVVRIGVVVNGEDTVEGDEIWYCVDNLELTR